MAGIPNSSNLPGGGVRQQRAAELRAVAERAAKQADVSKNAGSDTTTAPTGTRDLPPPDATGATGPVGQGEYIVQQGECISSIAKKSGHFRDTIWNDSANTDLRNIRKDPNVLLAGDRLTVPPIRRKDEPGATEEHHRFRRKGEPEMLRVRLLDAFDKPRANEQYEIHYNGTFRTGTTDANGELKEEIPANAGDGKLIVGSERQEYPLLFRKLDPITEISGVQARLYNLGFDVGGIDGQLGPRTRAAICDFQAQHDLEVTGNPDEATKQKLQELHGH